MFVSFPEPLVLAAVRQADRLGAVGIGEELRGQSLIALVQGLVGHFLQAAAQGGLAAPAAGFHAGVAQLARVCDWGAKAKKQRQAKNAIHDKYGSCLVVTLP